MGTVGECIGGKYLLLRLLGEGGMGQVFEARNQNTGRRVAIKVLLPEYARDAEVVQRFLREARAATSIQHPNVVDILDFDTDLATGLPFLVQEYLVGESLDAYLAAQPHNKLPIAEAVRLLLPMLSAMAAAHRLNIVHRDLKPGNIFMARDNAGELIVKVIDFGIARHDATMPDGHDVTAADQRFRTRTGVIIGTPAYMSPEQAGGVPDVDARTDVWALGVILYEMLTGELPYAAPNVNLLIGKLLYESPTPIQHWEPSLPPGVVELVECALQRDRDGRFPSAVEMFALASSRDLLDGATTVMLSMTPPVVQALPPASLPPAEVIPPTVPVPSPPSLTAWVSTPHREPAPMPRSRGRAAMAAGAVLLAVVGVATLALRQQRSPSTPNATAPVSLPLPVVTAVTAPPAPTAEAPAPFAQDGGTPAPVRAAAPSLPDTAPSGPLAPPSAPPSASTARTGQRVRSPRQPRAHGATAGVPAASGQWARPVHFDSEYP